MTGWRIGYAAGPAEIITAMNRVHQYTIMTAPTMSQLAALEGLQHGEPFVLEMIAEYDRRRKLIVSGLNHLGLETVEPHGAFYAFPASSHRNERRCLCPKAAGGRTRSGHPGRCVWGRWRRVRALLLFHRL